MNVKCTYDFQLSEVPCKKYSCMQIICNDVVKLTKRQIYKLSTALANTKNNLTASQRSIFMLQQLQLVSPQMFNFHI